MQATITYQLTEQAQRAAMAATGQPVTRKQEMTTEIPAEALDFFAVDEHGRATLNLERTINDTNALEAMGWKRDFHGRPLAPELKSSEDIIADLRGGRERLAAQRQEIEETRKANGQHNREVTAVAYQAFLSDPAARITGPLRDYVERFGELRSPADFWPGTDARDPNAELLTESERRNRLDAAEKKAFEAQKEQAKREYIAKWLREHAAEAVQEQYAAGLLARGKVLEMIADAAFAAAELPDDLKVKTCRDEQCPCGVKDVDTVPPAIYECWRRLKATLPEGTAVEFEVARSCEREDDPYANDGEGASDPYYTATIKLPVGPFVFGRRINLEAYQK